MILDAVKAVWAKWKVIAHKIGDFQARLLLAVFYFAVLGPFALSAKIFSDPLRLDPKSPAGWLPRHRVNRNELIEARKQS